MAITMKFLPRRTADVLDYGTQMHAVIAAGGFVPASIGLTANDVAELGTLVAGAQADADALNAINLERQAKTRALSGPGGTMEQLVVKIRAIAAAARVSGGSAQAIAAIGVARKTAGQTPISLNGVSPEFSLGSIQPGIINVRFRVSGSARPRARANNSIGAQIALVDGTAAPEDGEADAAPNVFVSRSPAGLDSSAMPKLCGCMRGGSASAAKPGRGRCRWRWRCCDGTRPGSNDDGQAGAGSVNWRSAGPNRCAWNHYWKAGL
jgi:hypothetical protein